MKAYLILPDGGEAGELVLVSQGLVFLVVGLAALLVAIGACPRGLLLLLGTAIAAVFHASGQQLQLPVQISMTTIQADTFLEVKVELQSLEENVNDLTVKLYSDFDAPALYSAAPMVPQLYEQLNLLASELQNNPYLQNLTRFTLKCNFTLNGWDCFDPLVMALNSKHDALTCHFVTSVAITENSFIHSIKNTTGEVVDWD